jgi:hypothetical protein
VKGFQVMVHSLGTRGQGLGFRVRGLWVTIQG